MALTITPTTLIGLLDRVGTMSDWQADARPIPPELAPEYVHADYTPTPVADSLAGVTVGQRIDVVMRERLKDLFGQVR